MIGLWQFHPTPPIRSGPTRYAHLFMREEIGSYLGLKLGTVSRILSFQESGLITTRNRYVCILDKLGLAELAERTATT